MEYFLYGLGHTTTYTVEICSDTGVWTLLPAPSPATGLQRSTFAPTRVKAVRFKGTCTASPGSVVINAFKMS